MHSNQPQRFSTGSTRFLTLLVPILLTACALSGPRQAAEQPLAVATPSLETSRASCSAHTLDHTSALLDQEIEQFLRLSEYSLTYRQTAIDLPSGGKTQNQPAQIIRSAAILLENQHQP